jgi:hypothetical protein
METEDSDKTPVTVSKCIKLTDDLYVCGSLTADQETYRARDLTRLVDWGTLGDNSIFIDRNDMSVPCYTLVDYPTQHHRRGKTNAHIEVCSSSRENAHTAIQNFAEEKLSTFTSVFDAYKTGRVQDSTVRLNHAMASKYRQDSRRK